jgi:hypothetical protein
MVGMGSGAFHVPHGGRRMVQKGAGPQAKLKVWAGCVSLLEGREAGAELHYLCGPQVGLLTAEHYLGNMKRLCNMVGKSVEGYLLSCMEGAVSSYNMEGAVTTTWKEQLHQRPQSRSTLSLQFNAQPRPDQDD